MTDVMINAYTQGGIYLFLAMGAFALVFWVVKHFEKSEDKAIAREERQYEVISTLTKANAQLADTLEDAVSKMQEVSELKGMVQRVMDMVEDIKNAPK